MHPIRLAARLTALAAAALLSLGAGKPAASAPHPNWLSTISMSPTGSHLLGNPDAAVKLIVYISYTCPHCARFQQESDAPLRLAYILPGKVQVEVRHSIHDPVDMTVAMLANCGDPSRFFLLNNMFLQTQSRWVTTMEQASAVQKARWTTGENSARMRAIAADFRFYAMMEQRGFDRPEVNRCLSDTKVANRIAAQTIQGDKLGVKGTPGFILNDVVLAGTYDWQSVNSQLEARF